MAWLKSIITLGLLGGIILWLANWWRGPPPTWQKCAEEAAADEGPKALLRLEALMAVARVFFGITIDTVGALVGRPVNTLVVERLQAAALWPMARKLMEGDNSQTGVPPYWAKSALPEACSSLPINGGIPCPALYIVESEAGRKIDTLPDGVWRRHHIIFLSKGLLESGIGGEELQALFTRELAHLVMGHWRTPRSWLVLQATGITKAKQEVWDRIPPDVGEDLRATWAQILELCRTNHAVVEAARRGKALGRGFDSLLTQAGQRWVDFEDHLEILADVCSVLEGTSSTVFKAQTIWSLLQRVGANADWLDEFSRREVPQPPARGFRRNVRKANELDGLWQTVKSLEPGEVKDSLRSLADSFTFDVGASDVARFVVRHWKPLLLLTLSVKRVTELAADRYAASALGGRIEPVVAGLVRMYGTPEECRRLDRGDVVGIIDGARTALAARSSLLRWELWWEGLTEGPTDPFLVLRIADLAAWAELPGDEGRYTPWRGQLHYTPPQSEDEKDSDEGSWASWAGRKLR